MPNTNCLLGMKCPECGQEKSFDIVATAVFTVYDDGTDDARNVEWDDSAYCYCTECNYEGNVGGFKNA